MTTLTRFILANGEGQHGTTITVDGAFDWVDGQFVPLTFKAGDRFRLAHEPHVYELAEDAVANIAGQATLVLTAGCAPRDNQLLIFEESARKG